MQATAILPNFPPADCLAVMQALRKALPPASPDTDEARAARDELAAGAVAALQPTDTFEALLAVDIVAAGAQAREAFGLAGAATDEPDKAHRCRAQAAAMLRLAQSGLRVLLRMQAHHEKAEAAMHPAAMERAGYWFTDVSVPAPAPAAEPAFESLPEAEQYALIYPDRAARIRDYGGLPPNTNFGPPDADLIAALVAGTSPILRALDHRIPPPDARAA